MKIEDVRYFCVTFEDRKLYVNNMVSDLPDEFKIRVKDDRPMSSVIWHRGKGGKINFTDHEKPRDFNPSDEHLQWILETIEAAHAAKIEQKDEENKQAFMEQKAANKAAEQSVIDGLDVDAYRAHLQNIVKDNAEDAVCTYTLKHSSSERQSWTLQYMEASSYRKDPSTPTPLIDSLAITRGRDKEAVVSKILKKAGEYSAWMGRIIGERQRITDELDNCTTREQLDKVSLDIEGDPQTKRVVIRHA